MQLQFLIFIYSKDFTHVNLAFPLCMKGASCLHA